MPYLKENTKMYYEVNPVLSAVRKIATAVKRDVKMLNLRVSGRESNHY